MVFFTGSPAHLDFPQGLSIYDNHSIGQDQYDYPMADTFDFQFGANAGPLYGAEPENQSTPVPSAYHVYTFQHMLDYVQPPTVVPNQLPQALNSPFPSLAQNHVFSFHVPPPRGRWQFTRNPRPVRFGHHGVCPTPTSLPSVPNLTQASNYVEMMMRNGSFRAANEYNRPLFLSCDHANCNPPQNVGLLSRRFPENDRWIQARAVAVSTIPRIKTGIYSLPAEIIDMISEQFPVIDKLTSLGAGELILQTPNRYRAYLVLAATCKDLRRIFYHRACLTKAVPMRSFPVVVRLFKTPDDSIHGLLVERLITQLPSGSAELLRDCLLSLPALRMLGIIGLFSVGIQELRSSFKHQPDFPNIKTVVIPVLAHPILARLPGVEEIVCLKDPYSLFKSAKAVLKSFRGPYRKERLGLVGPVLKSFTIISPDQERHFALALVEKFPRLRKLCLPEPSATDMSHFLGLKEITELEILVNPKSVSDKRYDLEPIKAMAIQILQGSECHKDCACDHRCECTRTGDCYKCKPPKRFLRIKACPGACLVAPYSASNGGGTIPEEYRLEEIRVSPRRVVSRK